MKPGFGLVGFDVVLAAWLVVLALESWFPVPVVFFSESVIWLAVWLVAWAPESWPPVPVAFTPESVT